jgi:replicative DNA helicase
MSDNNYNSTGRAPSDIDAEKSLLGSVILNNKVLEDIADFLLTEHFYDPRHSIIYKTMVTLWQTSRPVDVIFILDTLKLNKDYTEGEIETIDKSFLLDLVSRSTLMIIPRETAMIIKDKYILRSLIDISDKIRSKAFEENDRIENILDYAQKVVYELSESKIDKQFTPIHEILQTSVERITDPAKNGVAAATPTGLVDLDSLLGGFHNSDLVILAARPSMGKAQPLDAKVRTLEGWSTIGNINIGDRLASVDGKESVVLGKYPQGIKDIYEVTLSDGRSTLCCGEHLWNVSYREWDKSKNISTIELANKLTKSRYKNRLYIPIVSGDFGVDNNITVHPYLLGCLLGDGGLISNTPMISNKDDIVLTKIKSILSDELELNYSCGVDYRIAQKHKWQSGTSGVTLNSLTIFLKSFGLMGTNSSTKFIPSEYLLASKETRLKLLSGLLDTDGWMEKTGSVRYSTISRQLANDVQLLVRSLGGYCAINKKHTSYKYRGLQKQGKDSYVLNIAGLSHYDLFNVEYKKIRSTKNERTKRLNIVSVKLHSRAEAACILVSHPSHLYITNDYIVTHNTSLALEMMRRVAMNSHVGVAIFSLEMSKEQLVDKLISSTSGIPLGKIRANQLESSEHGDDYQKLGEALAKLGDAPIWIDDSSGGLNITELRTKARRLKSRHNVGLIIIDYLQLMRGYNGINYGTSRVQEVSDISRALKLLAKELDMPILALSQLSRTVESRDDKRPILSDLRESGSIEQDADVVMFVHREEMYNKESKNKGKANVIIAKHRNGETGNVELAWVGRLATFANLEGAKSSHYVEK